MARAPLPIFPLSEATPLVPPQRSAPLLTPDETTNDLLFRGL